MKSIVPRTPEECMAWIRAATTPEQRAARKNICFPILYGNPQKLAKYFAAKGEVMRHKLIEVASDKEVKPGMTLLTQRNEIWILDSFRVLAPPSTGRVTVISTDGEKRIRDFYPSVFDLEIREVPDE